MEVPRSQARRAIERAVVVEWLSAAMLALATIGSAWSAYQAKRWSGVQTATFGQAIAHRAEASKAAARANTETAVDVQLFLEWVQAVHTEDAGMAAFLRARMREEFKPALDAWLAKRTASEAVPDGTPFEAPSYRLANRAEAERRERLGAAATARSRQANQNGDNFIFAAVFFAAALALSGIVGKFQGLRARVSVLALGAFMLAIATVTVALHPQHIGLKPVTPPADAALTRPGTSASKVRPPARVSPT